MTNPDKKKQLEIEDNNNDFVSVIVPIYNGEKDLKPLIECFVNQTLSPEQTEFLLVDNNSSDSTAEIIKAEISKHQSKKINLKYLKEDNIQSSYAARNLGIKNAQGNILAFTDVDCRPQPQWLEKLIEPFNDQNTIIVAGEIKAIEGKSILEKYAQKAKILSAQDSLENNFNPYGQTANLAIRKEALKIVGLFRPYLTTGGDADICWRILREIETEIKYAPDAVILHRHRDNLTDFKSQWRRYGESNKYLHELHGIELMSDYPNHIVFYRFLKWSLKELPKNLIKLIMGKANLVDVMQIPIGIILGKARSEGQKQAKLPEEAKEIDTL